MAGRIAEKSADSDRIVLIGHSHGGNVALLASSQCKRKIEAVVCLSTPNVYYVMDQTDTRDKNRTYTLPVYCTPATCKNVGRIVTVTPQTDKVPGDHAEWRKGIDGNDALHATRHWRELMKTLSLRDDNGPYREFFDDLFQVEGVNHVFVSARLNVARDNIVYPCVVPDKLGQGAHQTVHSRRMGAVIGSVIKKGFDKDSLAYLQSMTQLPGCDAGEPILDKEYRDWIQTHALDFQHSGWILTEAVVKSASDWDRTKHLVSSDPDPYFEITTSETLASLYKSAPVVNSTSAKWMATTCVVPRNSKCIFKVYESNPLKDELVGSAELIAGPKGPPTELKGKNWSASLKWMSVHE